MAVSPDPRELAGLMEAAENAKFRFTGDITFLAYEDATHKYLGCRGCLVGAVAFLQGIRPTMMKPDTFDFAAQIGLSRPVFAGLSDGYDTVASGRDDRWMLRAWLKDLNLGGECQLPRQEYAAYQDAFDAAVEAVELYVSAGGVVAESLTRETVREREPAMTLVGAGGER